MIDHKLLLAALAGSAYAQSSAAGTATVSAGATTVQNASAVQTSFGMSVEDMWNLFVGPVEIAATTTTVSATPVPSSEVVAPPPLHYGSYPVGAENPALSKNASWSFPKGFLFGVASAAYQHEGAVKDEGRGPSNWDVLTHRATNFIADNSTGDVSVNHYYMYKQDIARMAALGVNTYSFSVSWSRVMPFGKGPVNEQALAHYEDVVDTCIQYGIQPMVTLYHWDTPLYLQNLYGGWLSEDIVDDFAAYAGVMFKRLGNKVQNWVTVNEPLVYCSQNPFPDGYFRNTTVPLKQQQYVCAQSTLLANAKAYHLGKSMGLNGTISFKTNGGYKIQLTNSSDDATATQRAWDFNEGLYADPIFGAGRYPESVQKFVGSFLRNLTDEEWSSIKGSADVFLHDAYTSQFYYAPDGGVDSCVGDVNNTLYPSCANSSYTYPTSDGGWLVGPAADPGSPWLHKATDWVPQLLKYITKTWKPKKIMISEFGFSEPFETSKKLKQDILTDISRSSYYHDYFQAMLMGIQEGAPLVGCLAWSFVDNLEWGQGYSTRFGMQYVNMSDPSRERSYKASFFQFQNAVKTYGTK